MVGPVSDVEKTVLKLRKVNAKSGPFKFCILLSPPSASPQEDFPVPTYFVAESFEGDTNSRLIGSNLHYMGSRCIQLVHGLQLVMCASEKDAATLHDATIQNENEDIEVDVMVTSCGPDVSGQGSGAISRLARKVKPRYIFYGADVFNASSALQIEDSKYATRSIAVGRSGRWVYAADVTPLRDMSLQDRQDTLPDKIREEVPADNGVKRGRDTKDENRKVRKRVRKDCWFCLSNEVEKHLVVAVGKHTYVALAKGGMNDSHLVVVPVAHVSGGTSKVGSGEMISEVKKHVKAIKRYYAEEKGSESIVFEWCGEAEMMHMCVQSIAIRREVGGRVAEVCVETAKRFGVDVEVEDGEDGLDKARESGARECFWAEMPGGKVVVAKFDEKKKLPANFGRVVVAQALGLVERMEWRKCRSTRQAEEDLARRVGEALGRKLVE